ncbi:cyclase family protein [Methanosarcina hadiensis]|uniref:cyclase family protein n=1 Tax=Methanosarcina hadiensis TaxID=3078083 RepID=UPI003977894C
MGEIIDVSLNVNEDTVVMPRNPEFNKEKLASIRDEGYELYKICMSNHIGTHIDAPAHFIQDGNLISQLSLNVLIGKSLVVEIHDEHKISVDELKKVDLKDYIRVLFKTRNSKLIDENRLTKDFVYIGKEAASYLVEKGVKLIGLDYFSIDRIEDEDKPAHIELAGNNVVVVEGINLLNVEPGEYELTALPMKINADGAPARVVLRK